MEPQRNRDQGLTERKGQKRKLEEEIEDEQGEISPPVSFGDARQSLLSEVSSQVNILNSAFSWREADRAAAKRATHVLAEFAKNEELVNVIVEGGAVPALVKHLQAPPLREDECNQKPFEHEVEKGSAFALGLLAVKIAFYRDFDGSFHKSLELDKDLSVAFLPNELLALFLVVW